jgi:hypothetical protein
VLPRSSPLVMLIPYPHPRLREQAQTMERPKATFAAQKNERGADAFF